MMSAFSKDIRRSIKSSLGRFIAIAAIAALGVGFYAGLRMTEPDMLVSADTYFDDNDMMDIRIVSTMGLSDRDIDDLSALEGVECVMPAHETDVLANVGKEQYAIRVHSIEQADDDGSKQPLNKLLLSEGRWPQAAGECVMLADAVLPEPLSLGDAIVATDCISDLSATFSATEFTVVGFVHAPYYICSSSLGTTSIGESQVNQVMYVSPQAFSDDLPYTEAFVSVEGAKEAAWGSGAYDDAVSAVVARIDQKRPEWEARRTQDLKSEAQGKVNDAQDDLDGEKTKVEDELSDAKAKLDEAEYRIATSQQELDQAWADYYSGVNELAKSRADAEAQFAEKEAQIDQIEQFAATLDQAKSQLDAAWAHAGTSYEQALSLPDNAAALKAQLAAMDPSDPAYEMLAAQLAQVQGAIDALAPLVAQQQEYDSGRSEYDAAIAQIGSIEAARSQLASARDDAERQFAAAQYALDDALAQIGSGQSQLESGKAEFRDGLAEYDSSKAEADEKIADAQGKIDDAQDKIDDIDSTSWYLLDRSKNFGCESYKSDAKRVGRIAAVFPFIFFLVAALVSLTTMTRMIEEERVLIGTYKALGYGRRRIASKYLIYVTMATALGCILGVSTLSVILPYVIQVAYAIIYYVPEFMTPLNLPLASLAAGLGFLAVLGATFAAAFATLRENPAELMLPRAPKAGRRILLERITPVWKRVSFSWKVTLRNLFRYKKRFFMTVIGIAGCTALLLTGLGLSNSINDIIDNQYGRIINYDALVSMSDDATQGDRGELDALLASGQYETPHTWVHSLDMMVDPPHEAQVACRVIVPADPEAFKDFVTLKPRGGEDECALCDEGAVITEKLANFMGASVGDTITVHEQDASGTMTSVTYEIPIAAVAENYTHHYIYLTPKAYESIWGKKPAYETVFVDQVDGNIDHGAFSKTVRAIDGVSTVSFNKDLIDNYREMLKSVNMIVVVLVLAAMALAIIVLCNLTNINIMERQREIASLKVLGFLPREVSAYIFRETFILSVIGALVGLVFGIVLEGFVVTTAEVELVMFGRSIHAASFAISFFLTLAFTAVIMFVMRGKLSKVDMVESLKSID